MKEIASQARIPFDEIHRTSPDHPAAPPPPHPSSAAHAPHPDQPRRPGEERHHAADDEPYDHHDDVPLVLGPLSSYALSGTEFVSAVACYAVAMPCPVLM